MQTITRDLCHHCGNEVINTPIIKEINNKKEIFCCEGCLTVSGIIHSSGKDLYYSLRGSNTLDRVKIENP
ncbi:MAG: TRASH domain-containing protein, partial [Spirochaetia bacterium]|nr:TRASH domain-containing protein [Spirochaetia bacterium]